VLKLSHSSLLSTPSSPRESPRRFQIITSSHPLPAVPAFLHTPPLRSVFLLRTNFSIDHGIHQLMWRFSRQHDFPGAEWIPPRPDEICKALLFLKGLFAQFISPLTNGIPEPLRFLSPFVAIQSRVSAPLVPVLAYLFFLARLPRPL